MTINEEEKFVGYSKGDRVEIPQGNLTEFIFSNVFQNDKESLANKNHSFDGKAIPPQRPAVIDSETGACLTWERLESDSLKIARGIKSVIGESIPYDKNENSDTIIFSNRTTILICLPNCLAFAPILFGSWAAQYTVSTIGTQLTSNELAYILAKIRPQALFITSGMQGEGTFTKALDLILQDELNDLTSEIRKEALSWAAKLQDDWQETYHARFSRGDTFPISKRRIWTVNVGATFAGGVDYYGTSLRRDGIATTVADTQDWTHLLVAPQGHKHGDSLDSLNRKAFEIKSMNRNEQKRRIALILWSSGTTGLMKGVLISHFAFIASVISNWKSLPILNGPNKNVGENWIALAPWSHMFGLTVILVPGVTIGATLILPRMKQFDLTNYFEIAKRYNVTHLHLSPPVVVEIYRYLQKNGRINDLEFVKGITCGGSPISFEIIETIWKIQNWTVHQAYGSSETGSISHAIELNYDQNKQKYEIGSVGKPFVNVEVGIYYDKDNEQNSNERLKNIINEIEKSDSNRLHCLNNCKLGEIYVRSLANMQGYYSGLDHKPIDEEITNSQITSSGWFKTGDEGIIDSKGQVWIIGRLKELIKIKGFQVAPMELDLLYGKSHLVKEAVAVGNGFINEEKIHLYLVPSNENILINSSESIQIKFIQEIIKECSIKTASYKWPSRMILCSKIPKSSTGKIQRKKLNIENVKGKAFSIIKKDDEIFISSISRSRSRL